jgi:hypothetical protein
MWAPIIFNFISTILTIIGLFGVYYHRLNHLLCFAFWQIASMSWNAFVAAFYLELGNLNRKSDYLNLGTGSTSWWEANGPNCEPQYNMTDHSWTALYELRPVSVDGCLLPFYAIEVFQAAIHFALSFFAILLVTCVLCMGRKEDDSFDYVGGFNTYTSYHSPAKQLTRLDPILEQLLASYQFARRAN